MTITLEFALHNGKFHREKLNKWPEMCKRIDGKTIEHHPQYSAARFYEPTEPTQPTTVLSLHGEPSLMFPDAIALHYVILYLCS